MPAEGASIVRLGPQALEDARPTLPPPSRCFYPLQPQGPAADHVATSSLAPAKERPPSRSPPPRLQPPTVTPWPRSVTP